LSLFYEQEKITSSHFLTISFGSVIFREFYNNGRNVNVEKVVEIGPLNSGCKVLEKVNKSFPSSLEKVFEKTHKDFLENQERIFGLPLPTKDLLIIAGDRRRDGYLNFKTNWDYFVLPSFVRDRRPSDGKVFLHETVTKETKNVKIFPNCHYSLYRDEKVLTTAKNYLQGINP